LKILKKRINSINNLGIVLMGQGKVDKAMKNFRRR